MILQVGHPFQQASRSISMGAREEQGNVKYLELFFFSVEIYSDWKRSFSAV